MYRSLYIIEIYGQRLERCDSPARDEFGWLGVGVWPPSAGTPTATPRFEDMDVQEVAKELTRIDCLMFKCIDVTELLRMEWHKQPMAAPTVTRCVQRTNLVGSHAAHMNVHAHWFPQLCRWVVSEVLAHAKLKDRLHALARMITLAQRLRDLNNFQSAATVLAALET